MNKNLYSVFPRLNKFYDNKISFIDSLDFTDNTTLRYLGLLTGENLAYMEKNKNKDLYNFTSDEITDVINSFPTSKINVKKQMLSIINRYIEYAIERGFLITGINQCGSITDKDISANESLLKSSYISLHDFYKWINELNESSDIDKAQLILLRYGLNVKESIKAKFDDVNREDNIIKITKEDNGVKFYPIDNRFCDYIDKAYLCDSFKDREYKDTDFIIKQTKLSRQETLSENSYRNRLGAIGRDNDILRPNINMLRKSRMYDFLLMFKEENNEVTYDDVKTVVNMFEGVVNEYNKALDNKYSLLKKQFQDIFGIKVITRKNKG